MKSNNQDIMRSRNLVLAILASLLLSSCWDFDDYKNFDIETFNPSFGLPVLNSTITLQELLDASVSNDTTFLVEVRNDSIFLRFSEMFSYQVNLNIPDNEFSQIIPVVPFTPNFYYDNYTTIDNALGSGIKSIDIKTGELWIEFEKNFPQNVDVDLHLNSLVLNSNDDRLQVSANWSSNPNLSRHSFPLTETTLELFRKVGEDTLYNTLNYAILVGESLGAGNLTVRIGIVSLEYSKIIGNIKFAQSIDETEMNIDFFSQVVDGRFFLKNPIFKLNIGTSFGTPFSLLFDEIRFENNMGDVLYLNNEGVPASGDFLIGSKNYFPFFSTDQTPFVKVSYKLDGNNSNVEDILPFSPNKILLSGGFELGDTDQPQTYLHNFFIRDTSSIAVDIDVEVPFAGSIEDFKLSYVLEGMEWPNPDDFDMVQDYNATLFIKTINGIPLTFALQGIFKDENGVAIDSLFNSLSPESIIQSPQIVNEMPNPSSPTKEKLSVIQVSKEKYENIYRSKEMELILLVNTGDGIQKDVIVKASNSLGVQISVAFNAQVKPTF